MRNVLALTFLSFLFFYEQTTLAGNQEKEKAGEKQNIKYRSGKAINFEKLLIEGQIRRPQISVVTGNVQQGTDGLVRLRDNFLDRVSSDFGEEVK